MSALKGFTVLSFVGSFRERGLGMRESTDAHRVMRLRKAEISIWLTKMVAEA